MKPEAGTPLDALPDVAAVATPLPPRQLVAHRGWPVRFPENTLTGFQHALASGAVFLETDIQIADDGEGWLFHDVHLERLCRLPGTVFELRREAAPVDVTGSHATAHRLGPAPITRLSQLVQLMKTRPDGTWFWEIKPESIARHGNSKCADLLFDLFDQVRERAVIISFEVGSLWFFRRRWGARVGAVVRHPDPSVMAQVAELEPEFVFCDHQYWAPADLGRWPGGWHWVAYTINEIHLAREYLSAGATLIETDDVGTLLGIGEGL